MLFFSSQYAPRADTDLTVTSFATAQKESSVTPCQEHACVLKEGPASAATDVNISHMIFLRLYHHVFQLIVIRNNNIYM